MPKRPRPCCATLRPNASKTHPAALHLAGFDEVSVTNTVATVTLSIVPHFINNVAPTDAHSQQRSAWRAAEVGTPAARTA